MNSMRERRWQLHEPLDVRLIRNCLRGWPFARGKGVVLRLCMPLLKRREFAIAVEPEVLVHGELDDWMVLHYFAEPANVRPAALLSRELIRTGDIVFDVGANIGLWALGAARRVGPAGLVYAFEPVPANIERLRRNGALNQLWNLHCEPLALSDRCGRARFYPSNNDNSGLGSLADQGGGSSPIEVEQTTIDGFCDSSGVAKVDLIKLDVEGAELLVLRGAHRILSSPEAPIVMFEVCETLAGALSSSGHAVKRLLADHGYDVFSYNGRRLRRVAIEERHEQDDLFALKPRHCERHPALRALLASNACETAR